MKERSINCDILRIIAFILVVCVHSINYVGFYGTTNLGVTMLILNIIRVFFMACVPLFMVLSGYLMKSKQLTKDYYLKVSRIILTYLLCSAVCFNVVPYITDTNVGTINDFLIGLINFNAAPYAWYVEMYLGLYLLIPFLNVLWQNLENKKNKNILLITLFIIFVLPTLTNLKEHIVPSYWFGNGYPILYYYIGCYFKDFNIKINFRKILILLFFIILNGIITYNTSYEKIYINGIFNNYYSFGSLAATLLFTLIIFNLKINIKSEKVIKFISKISYLTFGAYLLSYIFDLLLYPLFIDSNKYISSNIIWQPLVVIIIIILSLLSSYIVDLIEKLIRKIKNFILNNKNETNKI